MIGDLLTITTTFLTITRIPIIVRTLIPNQTLGKKLLELMLPLHLREVVMLGKPLYVRDVTYITQGLILLSVTLATRWVISLRIASSKDLPLGATSYQ